MEDLPTEDDGDEKSEDLGRKYSERMTQPIVLTPADQELIREMLRKDQQ